jgi:hypothetical protein
MASRSNNPYATYSDAFAGDLVRGKHVLKEYLVAFKATADGDDDAA